MPGVRAFANNGRREENLANKPTLIVPMREGYLACGMPTKRALGTPLFSLRNAKSSGALGDDYCTVL